MPLDFDQFSTVKPLLSGYPAWIGDELEQKRIAAYQMYEQIYWNVPESFKLVQRGDEASPIYIPSGRIIVETMNRFVSPGMKIIPDPNFGDPNAQALAVQVMTDLVRRERLYSRFRANKRFGIMRGDWAFHLYADPNKEPGSRVSIFPVDPGSLFKIWNPENLDEVIGYHIVDQFMGDGQNGTDRGKAYIRRLTYRKETGKGGPSPITVEDIIFEVDEWGGPGMAEDDEKIVKVLRPATRLPDPIDDLPIYHIMNFDEPGGPWGSSEMRGLERIMAAVDQGISDEELILAVEGLGVYATDAGAPQDPDTGEDMAWNLGPGRVVEVPAGNYFNRVSGINSVQPLQDHLKYLHERMDEAASTPAVAKGKVDATVAESGIALLLQHGPIISLSDEKDGIVIDVMTNMLFNLSKWFVAYEGSAMNSLVSDTRWVPIIGDKIPPNKQKQFDNIIAMISGKIIPNEVGWDMLRKLGYELPDNATMSTTMSAQTAADAQAQADALASRISGELNQPVTGN
jgi:hypothetical protein